MYTLYVLELNEGKYYVGTTKRNINERLYEHIDGEGGAAWTSKYGVLRILYTYNIDDLLYEDLETKRMMRQYGIENVRGGSYTRMILDNNVIEFLNMEIKHSKKTCYVCGNEGHYGGMCSERRCRFCNLIVENSLYYNTCDVCGTLKLFPVMYNKKLHTILINRGLLIEESSVLECIYNEINGRKFNIVNLNWIIKTSDDEEINEYNYCIRCGAFDSRLRSRYPYCHKCYDNIIRGHNYDIIEINHRPSVIKEIFEYLDSLDLKEECNNCHIKRKGLLVHVKGKLYGCCWRCIINRFSKYYRL